MAYKQSPGRMNMPKTGRGLSPNLLEDPKDPKSSKSEVKEQKFDNDPVKHFKSFPSKVERINAKNPYPNKSVRQRKFKKLQESLSRNSM